MDIFGEHNKRVASGKIPSVKKKEKK